MQQARRHGSGGPWVVVLHGGPGAPGSVTPVAERLGAGFRVLEPFQRDSGARPLTVAQHVADLHELIDALGTRPVLVGHSWGAMLALAYGAAHPYALGGIVLVGCGTFDPESRRVLIDTRESRMTTELRRRLAGLADEISDPDQRLQVLGELVGSLDSFDPVPENAAAARCDLRAQQETWADMMRLQEEDVYPQAFAAIEVPVLMLHGDYDPHPGPRIRDSLRPLMPQLEYRQLQRCGHEPWIERHAAAAFFRELENWIVALGDRVPKQSR